LEDIGVLCDVLRLSHTAQVWDICQTVWGDDMIRADIREVIEEFLQTRGLSSG